MAKDLLEKFKSFELTSSDKFPLIMQKYDSFGKHMSMRAFWMTYVKPLDASITQRKWEYFIKKFSDVQKQYVQTALAKSNETALSESKLEANSLKNILKIADVSLEGIAENPELIHTIPIATRMRWFFAAMKARDTRFKTNLQARQDEREQSMFEKMMEGAQYGGYEADQVPVIDGEINTNAEEHPVLDELSGGI